MAGRGSTDALAPAARIIARPRALGIALATLGERNDAFGDEAVGAIAPVARNERARHFECTLFDDLVGECEHS